MYTFGYRASLAPVHSDGDCADACRESIDWLAGFRMISGRLCILSPLVDGTKGANISAVI